MSRNSLLSVAVVGLGFGEDFLPIYQAHPDVGEIGIVDTSPERLHEVGARHGIEARYTSYEEMLQEDRWDAVHILAPVSFHADYSIAALDAGKHCACAVPMATDLEDLNQIIAAQERSGKNYMMMETTVYSSEFRAIESLYRAGRMGELTLYHGVHIQNLDGYPPYWLGFPPMHYLTHALSPALQLTQCDVATVTAVGTGRLAQTRRSAYDNPFPAEIGLFELRGSDLVPNVTMSFFQTARSYIEGFSVYGESIGVEWPRSETDGLRTFELQALDPNQPTTGLRGRRSTVGTLEPADGLDRLPAAIQKFVHSYDLVAHDGSGTIRKKAEHGGSHPHLVHEFVSSVVAGRAPEIDAVRSAAWTAPGICGHQSALQGGLPVEVPDYRR